MSLWDDEAGYDRTDPKHPDWADMAADRADMERKRMKEDEHYAESLSEPAGSSAEPSVVGSQTAGHAGSESGEENK